MKIKLLTKKENEIMSILWQNKKPLNAHQIKEADNSLSIYTIQQVLQRLLKMDFIKVAEINYSGTVLARFYAPKLSKTDYMKFLFGTESTVELASFLIESNNNDEELKEIEALIQKHRESLKEERI